MLTKQKDLRTGSPVWQAYPIPDLAVRSLDSDQKADVVIIGAGVSGAMLAEELSQTDLSVIILDRREPMKGSTFASTALLIYEIDTPILHLIKKIGYNNAIRVWRRSKLGLESLAAKIRSLDIECDFHRRGSLYLSGSLLDAKAMRTEELLRNLSGLPTQYLTQGHLKEMYGISRRCALGTFDNIAVNPVQMTAGFLRIALEKGVKLYAPANVENVTKEKGNFILHTDTGAKISAKYLVYATGYEIPKVVHTKRHKIQSTWVIATKKQPKKLWRDERFIWEASDPYLYIRTTSDGRVICGGEDESFSNEEKRDALISKKTHILERKLGKLFPQLDNKAEFAWAGSFGTSTTGLPSIGEIPGMPNSYAVMAYGGNGISFSRIAAEIITSSILGKPDPDEDLFAF